MFSSKRLHEMKITRERDRIARMLKKAKKAGKLSFFIRGDVLPETQQWLENMGCECMYMEINKKGWEVIIE